jgi:ATP-dependent exoDNAse (exonuclease V) alpha subunit
LFKFTLNSGVIKVSTIHSFKGYESPTVFLIIDDVDSPELVYVGLTRAKINLVVFVKKKSKYEDFFIKSLGKECP